MKASARALATAVALALAACGDSSGPERSLTGTWRGQPSADLVFRLRLTQRGATAVEGEGTLAAPDGSGPLPLDVAGAFNRPDVGLLIAPVDSSRSLVFTGRADAAVTTITGRI